MLTNEELREIRPHMLAMVESVSREDLASIEAVYRAVSAHRVEPAHALAVMLADEVLRLRGNLAKAIEDGTKYAEAYLEEQRKVRELRGILNAKVAAAPKSRGRAA